MNSYTEFAKLYDLFMDNISYEKWGEYIIENLHENNITSGIVIDLGCGTGKISRILREQGYDVVGVDLSETMLDIAKQHNRSGSTSDITYVKQNMITLDLDEILKEEKAVAIVSACDSLNYILEEEELLKVFKNVRKYLSEEGIFIFDMKTPFTYEEILADYTFAENRDEGSFIWENDYDPESRLNTYDLTLFIKNQNEDTYVKHSEIHHQRNYDIATIISLLEDARMCVNGMYEDYSYEPLMEDSDRVTILAVKEKS